MPRALLHALRALVFALALSFGLSATAEESAPLRVRLYTQADRVRVAYSVVGAFTERFRTRVSGGLTSRAKLTTYLLGADGERLGRSERSCELRLDVWDDHLYARFVQDGAKRTQKFTVIDDAIRACGEVDLPIARTGQLRGGGYLVEVVVDLDPVSKELRDRSRRFTSNPRGAGAGSPGLFGSIARLFQSSPEVKGHVFRFRSARLAPPQPGRKL